MSRVDQPLVGTPLVGDQIATPWWVRWFSQVATHASLISTGNGTPEGTVVAKLGRLYIDEENGKLYVKEADDGESTGWAVK